MTFCMISVVTSPSGLLRRMANLSIVASDWEVRLRGVSGRAGVATVLLLHWPCQIRPGLTLCPP